MSAAIRQAIDLTYPEVGHQRTVAAREFLDLTEASVGSSTEFDPDTERREWSVEVGS